MKKYMGFFMIVFGTLLAFVMTLFVLDQKIKNPSFDLFSVCLLFLVPALLIGVGYEMLDSSNKGENGTK